MPGEESRDRWPDPAERLRTPLADGVPATLADGREWLLADGGLGNRLDGQRDRLYDQSARSGAVDMQDVLPVAFVLLTTNYDLTEGEAWSLILRPSADEAEARVYRDQLTKAVGKALFGDNESPRSYSDWAATMFHANGLDPEAIPGRYRGMVLDTLVATGRAVPVEKFVTVAARARAWDSLMSIATPPT